MISSKNNKNLDTISIGTADNSLKIFQEESLGFSEVWFHLTNG